MQSTMRELEVLVVAVLVAVTTAATSTTRPGLDATLTGIQKKAIGSSTPLQTLRQRDDTGPGPGPGPTSTADRPPSQSLLYNESNDSTATSKEVQPTGGSKEEAPEDTFAVRDDKGKICILAKFGAKFSIKYQTSGGEQMILTEMPQKVRQKGTCGTTKGKPALEVSWPSFRFKLRFRTSNKCTKEEMKLCWGVGSMDLSYNTSSDLFPAAKKSDLRTIRSDDKQMYFKAGMNKSYICPSPEVVPLYNSAGDEKGTVRFTDMQLQPFYVTDGIFATGSRCDQVSYGFGPEPYVDKTVPIAAGSTLAVLTLLMVVGYAIKRSIHERRVQYSNME